MLTDCAALGYPSQSEADYALLAMLCFYTRSNEQVKRLFRASGLGRRPKASADDRYLNLAISKLRATQPTNAEIQAAKESVQLMFASNAGLQTTTMATTTQEDDEKFPLFALELLALPHGLGDMQHWVHGQLKYPSLAAAGVTALALLTHFAMAHITVDSFGGLGLNEQYMVLAPTGFGKEDLRKPFALLEYELKRMPPPAAMNMWTHKLPFLQYSAPASLQGLHRLLETHSAQTFLSDEFADWIVRAEKDPCRKEAQSHFMQAYSKAHASLAAPNAVTNQYKPVENPRILIFATSTAERMAEVLTRSQAESGMLNRYVISPVEQERLEKRYEGQQYEPQKNVVDLAAWIVSLPETVMKFAPEAWQYFKKHDSEVIEPLRFTDNVLAGRLSEQAIKMAALIALSDRRLQIERKDLETAYAVRENLYWRSRALIEKSGAISGLHATAKAVDDLTKTFKRHAEIRRGHLPNYSRTYKSLANHEREGVIRTLVANGVCKDGARKGWLVAADPH